MASKPSAVMSPKGWELVPSDSCARYSRRTEWHIIMAATGPSEECHPEQGGENYFQPRT